MIGETAFSPLTSANNCVTVSIRELFLAFRQSLLMQIAAEERYYHDKRAAQFLQLGKLEDILGVERTQKRNGK
ncbi:MAG: hypothetical protein DDT21_01852 [Syntrophomonadaceae bacterium]|nr:hypothetical protein [Bacillota bacterium]